MSTHNAVVVAYDFSHTGHAALRRAVTLAAAAPNHVLHVVCVVSAHAPIPSIPVYDGVDYVYAARVQEALTTAVHDELVLAAPAHRVDFFVHARIGKPAEEILWLAREVGADLIVMGSHSLHGLERLVLGSVSESVVRNASCSVEVVRSKSYGDVELIPVVEVPEHDHTYLPPHRYEYADTRVQMRPADWPLY
ncbi:MAG: universal stress protein [Myxococcales bacterium]|nr:universal stress protein [Myxococcales bacterium]